MIQYDDGHWIKGRLPNGEITGILFGETAFRSFGGSYVYDSRGLVLTYEMGGENTFEGYLGLLNFKAKSHFQEILNKPDRFIKFSAYGQEEYSKVLHRFSARYANWISFDGK